MRIRRSLLKDTVSVETYSGESAYGPIYASARTVRVNIDLSRRLVRNTTGDEAVSELTLHVHPDDVDYFTPESRITVSGRLSRVLSARPYTWRGNTAYIEVSCL